MPSYGEYRVDPIRGLIYGKRGKPVGCLDTCGYLQIDTYINGIRKVRSVHRWIWTYVNGAIPDGLEVNHINGIKTDNRISNLELISHRENILHAYRIGLKSNAGMKHPSRKLDETEVRDIRLLFDKGIDPLHISRLYGVSRTTVNEIGKRKTWAHLKE